jgi:predicted nucleic acid-binding protein
MMLFFDTSAFIKRYIDEGGSSEIQNLCEQADDIGISMFLPVEAISTFARLKREKRISLKQYRLLKEALLADIRDINIIPLSPPILASAISCLENSPLKALDAIHIGCALEYQPDFFVSGDAQQLSAAARSGLRVRKMP